MLRNRSRAVTGKQALMADPPFQSPSSSSYTKPLRNPIFGSPRFRAFATRTADHSVLISPSSVLTSPSSVLISPTSVLDSKPFFSLQNSKPIFPENKHKISHPNPIGLALIEDKNDSKPTKSLIFSAKLRVLIPPPTVDGGGSGGSGLMTVKEMEVCEEYTCVRRHGPNAKTTHIFDNFVVKSFVDYDSQKKKNNEFLSFCFTCNNTLHLTNDIYIYRGDKAFCSQECRNQEMLLDEQQEDSC
ncbi:protein MARD1-like [Cucurbita moschata]|uniref:Protein MARD1-like n=1 Tax=Cucurbita moschata TaxID=3662 RepID=A0A6J1GQ92_CUCMO|nr:protein MARD1-like [Cucurbita moschata]